MSKKTSSYNKKVGAKICTELAEGASLISICQRREMPSLSTVYRWLSPSHPSYSETFANDYLWARIWQRETLIERLEEIANDPDLTSEMRKSKMDAIKTKIVHLEPKKHGVVGDRKLVIRVIYEDIIAEQGRKEPS